MQILKYEADRGPVAYVVAAFLLHLGVWWYASLGWALAAVLPLVVLSMFVAPINHHHQHLNTFRFRALNRFYEILLSLQVGVGPYAWVLHHNLGHHRNYLKQPPCEDSDESRWKRQDGTTMGRFEYSVALMLSHQPDIFRVGRRYPKYRAYFLWMKLPLYGVLGLLFWLRPENTFLVFIVPAFLTLFHTTWATYEHHAGCEPTSHMDGSVNRLHPVYNLLTGNLGYHTAHHTRPGTHWSLLPKLHEEIKAQIPEKQLLTSFW